MVDPNRKINRLTEKDIEFLDECQDEFENRFTDEDAEYINHCSKPLPDPPIIENWGFSGAGYGHRGGGGGQRNSYSRNKWNKRGQDRHYHGGGNQSYRYNKRRVNNEPYNVNFRGGHSREERPHKPMDIRRDYGNFVPASKD
ncbi:RNA guanine-N7 methyltransferase activating subunit [Anastrepha obliqua]|uniref:RNA guanine-N7 methyltransferase activating subunit n=1 Tax=Anastrepha obliqua TaxID=95512 RepID=UPI0024094311|nr:RNA guanine-N7 methyltransferase activating subunit [Anastrepha obliqua]